MPNTVPFPYWCVQRLILPKGKEMRAARSHFLEAALRAEAFLVAGFLAVGF